MSGMCIYIYIYTYIQMMQGQIKFDQLWCKNVLVHQDGEKEAGEEVPSSGVQQNMGGAK